ncbi:MAG: hypothetical protein IIT64_08705 [Bacteroidaceae bacterium]|jgi:hypothetical protein|nr:hypothetical protein [Bacteroidaceae bacterium]
MKKYFIILLAGLLSTACMNDFEDEPVSVDKFTAENVGTPNTTISKVRSKYSSIISNSGHTPINEDLVIEGIVTSSDITGNLYQVMVIQEMNEDGTVNTTVPGINIGIKGVSNLYTIFPVGQVVRISLKGLYIGGYGQCPKIGEPYITASATPTQRIGPMCLPSMTKHIQKVGKADAKNVKARELTADDVKNGDLSKLSPMLVSLKTVKIKEADGFTMYAHKESATTYSVENNILFSDKSTKILLYTSSSATFANNLLPEGWLNMQGILSRYNSSWQFQLISEDDIEKIK